MTIHVRKAQPSDIDQLISFQRAMAKETEDIALEEHVLRKGIRSVFDDPGKGKYLVAESDTIILGCLMLTYEWSDWRNGTVLWIQSVYVDTAHRGKGVYKALYDYVKAEVENSSDLMGIRLYVDKRNMSAQKVYEKLGMNGEHYQVYEWMKYL